MSRSVLQVLRDAALRAAAHSEEGFRRGQVTLDAACNKADAVDDAIATVERMAEALGGFLAEFGDKTDNSANVRNARAALRAYRGEQA